MFSRYCIIISFVTSWACPLKYINLIFIIAFFYINIDWNAVDKIKLKGKTFWINLVHAYEKRIASYGSCTFSLLLHYLNFHVQKHNLSWISEVFWGQSNSIITETWMLYSWWHVGHIHIKFIWIRVTKFGDYICKISSGSGLYLESSRSY